MVKAKQQVQCLSKKNISYGSSSKSKSTTRFALTRNMRCSRRRSKRRVGVTLLGALKKKQPPVSSVLNAAAADASAKQKVITGVHKKHKHSSEYRPKCSSFIFSESEDCYTPDVLSRNDTAHSFAETTSSCFSPIVIDDSSDTDHSSTANVFSASAVSEAGNGDDVDYFSDGTDRITHALG